LIGVYLANAKPEERSTRRLLLIDLKMEVVAQIMKYQEKSCFMARFLHWAQLKQRSGDIGTKSSVSGISTSEIFS